MAFACLYMAGVLLGLCCMILYAHQDKKDDSKLKLRSSALTIGDQNTPMFLRACGRDGLWYRPRRAHCVFDDANACGLHASLSCFAAHLAWQVESADLSDPANLGAAVSGATASSRRSCLLGLRRRR